MARRIKVKPDLTCRSEAVGMDFKLWGYYDGKKTYLAFGGGDACYGYLEDRKLYRLAKAIVRQFEKTKEQP